MASTTFREERPTVHPTLILSTSTSSSTLATRLFGEKKVTHIAKYIGQHADTDDFVFQEQMRQLDLAIKELVKQNLGSSKAEKFFVNGWGQVLAAVHLLDQNSPHIKISLAFEKFLVNEIEQTISKGALQGNPFACVNVRESTKRAMMYPHPGEYNGFKSANIEMPIKYLNIFVKEADLNFSLYEGKLYLKINPEDDKNIFNKLWAENLGLAKILDSEGYCGVEKNKECPHVTLINSDVIAKIRDQFISKYGPTDGPIKFNAFLTNFLETINKEFKGIENPLLFTELASTYSEDYTPFEEVIVAKLKAPFVEHALTVFNAEVEKELGFKASVKPKSDFHLTIATKYRQPTAESELKMNIETILKGTGKYAEQVLSFWSQLASS